MLTNNQIEDLAKAMSVPLAFVGFKDKLPKKLEYNKSYIINLENELDGKGVKNTGSHWSCWQVNKYKSGEIQGIYFDSFGAPMPQIIKERIHHSFGVKIAHTTKDVQSLMNSACGWFCLAFLHFINVFEKRTRNLYTDTETFLSLFDDLNKSIDFKKNEYVLKLFFQPKEQSKRKEIDVISPVNNIVGDGIETEKATMEVNYI